MVEVSPKKNDKPIPLRDMFMVETGNVYPKQKELVNSLLTMVDSTDGTLVPVNKHGAQGSEWQKNIIVKAKSSNRDIIPIHISGRCSNFFYKLSNFRNKHYTLTFGKPIPYDTFDKRFTPKEWAQLVKDHVYIIAANSEREFSYIQN